MADSLLSINDKNQITLKSGKKIALKGIELAPESQTVLDVLISGKELDFEEDGLASQGSGGLENEFKPVYLYVTTSQALLPVLPGKPNEISRIMVNEWLLRVGAAQIKMNELSAEKAMEFQKIQDQAKNEGQGIWSYEEIYRTKKDKKSSPKITEKPSKPELNL